jgi:hypothetical protein
MQLRVVTKSGNTIRSRTMPISDEAIDHYGEALGDETCVLDVPTGVGEAHTLVPVRSIDYIEIVRG